MLELAVVDAGLGIPRTLAAAAGALLPDLVKKVRGVSSGQRAYEVARAAMHAGLCYYSFDHKSTSKDNVTKKFRTPEHELNWRGLYRCYRQVAELGGGISVTSGRGRAGYLPTSEGVDPFQLALPIRADLPGTLLTVRLPLPVRPRPVALTVSSPGGRPIEFQGDVIRWDALTAEKQPDPAQRTANLNFIAVSLPFIELVRDDEQAKEHRLLFRKVRSVLQNIELHSVPVFCFGTLPEAWEEFLRAFVADQHWHSAFDGPPRLVGFLTSQGNIRWVFAGAIPQEAESALNQFEADGRWEKTKGASEIVAKLFTELLAHHTGAISWQAKTHEFRLVHHDGIIRGQDYERIVASAFAQYWSYPDVRNEVVTEEPGKVILLPTGTCVRRHFSVFKMLNQSPALSTALSRAFSNQLNEVFRGNPATLVLDQPASRHIAHALLECADCEIYTLDELARRLPGTRSVVLFADSIFKGETARRALEEIRLLKYRVTRVIAAPDLRMDRREKQLGDVPFAALVSPDEFVAEVVENPDEAAKIPLVEGLDCAANPFR